MTRRRIIFIALLLLTLPALDVAAPAAGKHHRSEMDRWMVRQHHREAREEHWATEADQKAQAQEEKHASHEGKWEKMMDAIGRPQEQAAPGE